MFDIFGNYIPKCYLIVAISGFYKRLNFQVVGSIDGKPTVFDDTVYCLSTRTKKEAVFLTDLLNSEPCQAFLSSMVFWSEKRPITVDLLKRVDLGKLASLLGRDEEYKYFTTKIDQPPFNLTEEHQIKIVCQTKHSPKEKTVTEKIKPIIEVKPHSYQPSKAEKEEVVSYNCLVDEAVNALFRQVIIKKKGVE